MTSTIDELIATVIASPIFWGMLGLGIIVIIGGIFGRRVYIDLKKRRFEFTKDEPRDKLCENCPHVGKALSVLAGSAIDTGVEIAYLRNVVLIESQRDVITERLMVINEEMIQAYQLLLKNSNTDEAGWAEDDLKVYSLIVNRFLDIIGRHVEGHFRKQNAMKVEDMNADDVEGKVRAYIAEYRRVCSIYYPINKAYVPVGDALNLFMSGARKSSLYVKFAAALREIWNECIDKRIKTDGDVETKKTELQEKIASIYKPQGAPV